MNYTITLSSKGQIVLPAAVRKNMLKKNNSQVLTLNYDELSQTISIQTNTSLESLSISLTKIAQQKNIKPLADASDYYNNRVS
jgi:DNA-binding transcriptional regulator/RsmH inhibitor MraZ